MTENKKCITCGDELELSKFNKSSRKDKIYYSNSCRRCTNAKSKQKRNEYYKNRRQKEPGYGKVYCERYRKSEHGKEKIREYCASHANEISLIGKNWYKNNKNRRREVGALWIKNNPEAYKKLYTKANKKRLEDPVKNLAMRMRGALRKSFGKLGVFKRKRTFEYLGYSNIDLYNHLFPSLGNICQVCKETPLILENSNIDHIIPICLASSEEDVIKLNQLSNLRLICEVCNLAKISSDLRLKSEKNNVRLASNGSEYHEGN
jgi:5-methylcytosine-specific restriction endonuclease McrA